MHTNQAKTYFSAPRRFTRRTVHTFSACIAAILAVPAFAVSIDSRIDAVTVYSAGAIVTRSAQVELQSGATEVTFAGLSSAIDPTNVRLEVASGSAELGQIRFDQVQSQSAFDEEVRNLTAKIEAAELELVELDDQGKTAQLKLKFLDGIAAGYAKESWFEGARGSADVESWRAALNVLEEGSGAARRTIRDVQVGKREKEKALSQMKRELRDLRGGSLAQSNLSVVVEVPSAQRVTLQVHYFVDDAEWSPLYEARLDSNNGKLRILQRAEVSQTSDEDWRNAELTLSTSDPSSELAAPDPASEFLDLFDPEPPMLKRQMSATLADSTVAMEEIVVTGSRVATPDVGAYAVNYRIPGRVSVANDADEAQTFDLATFAMDADLITRVVPRESLDAFLTAQFVHNSDVPLYGSRLLIYVDRVYVGESWMPTALPGQQMVLPMGQDRQVTFSLQDQGGEKGEGGFIGRSKTEQTDLIFEVTNRRTSATTVEVIDVLPVAVNKDIDVTLGDDATPATETDFDDKRGVLVWRNSVAGGDRWRIRHQYEVEYPANKVLLRRGG